METTQFTQRDQMDCQHLWSFFSGNGPRNNQKLLEIITGRNLEERKQIRQAYNARFNQDFLLQLSTTQRNNKLDRLAYLCMEEPHKRDAEIMRDALFGASIDQDALIEVACARASSQLRLIKQAYHDRYRSNVEEDVALKTNGCFKEVLVAMLSSRPGDSFKLDMSMAMCDAKTLYEAIESGKSIDKMTILSLVNQSSTDQLRTILQAYKQLYGHELCKSLRREKCGELGAALRAAIRCVQHPDRYFAKRLRRTWKNGQWRSDSRAQELLIRTMVTRSTVDIRDIDNAFAAKAGVSLEVAIRRDCGDSLLADFLVTLLKC